MNLLARLYLTTRQVTRGLAARALINQRLRVLQLPLNLGNRFGIKTLFWILGTELIVSFTFGILMVGTILCIAHYYSTPGASGSAILMAGFSPVIDVVRVLNPYDTVYVSRFNFIEWLTISRLTVVLYVLTFFQSMAYHFNDIYLVSLPYLHINGPDLTNLCGVTLGVFYTYGVAPLWDILGWSIMTLGSMIIEPFGFDFIHVPTWGDLCITNPWLYGWAESSSRLVNFGVDLFYSSLATLSEDVHIWIHGYASSDVKFDFEHYTLPEVEGIMPNHSDVWSEAQEELNSSGSSTPTQGEFDQFFADPDLVKPLTAKLPSETSSEASNTALYDQEFVLVHNVPPKPWSLSGRVLMILLNHPYLLSAGAATLVIQGGLALVPVISKVIIPSLGMFPVI
jgi:hypothetical protein